MGLAGFLHKSFRKARVGLGYPWTGVGVRVFYGLGFGYPWTRVRVFSGLGLRYPWTRVRFSMV